MTSSRIFMEPSRETMSGKGREGNKEGKGRRREPFTTSFRKSPRARRDVMVSATRLDDRPDLASITHLDFKPFIPCMARTRGAEHGTQADALIVGQCPACRATKMALRRYGICWRHWGRGKRQRLFCEACGHRDVYSGGFFRIVEVLR